MTIIVTVFIVLTIVLMLIVITVFIVVVRRRRGLTGPSRRLHFFLSHHHHHHHHRLFVQIDKHIIRRVLCDVVTTPSVASAWVGRSVARSLCVSLRVRALKEKKTGAIDTELGTHVLHGRASTCINLEVERTRTKVTRLRTPSLMHTC